MKICKSASVSLSLCHQNFEILSRACTQRTQTPRLIHGNNKQFHSFSSLHQQRPLVGISGDDSTNVQNSATSTTDLRKVKRSQLLARNSSRDLDPPGPFSRNSGPTTHIIPPAPFLVNKRNYSIGDYFFSNSSPKSKRCTYSIEKRGALYSEGYRIFFRNKDGSFMSPFHDIPLKADRTGEIYNMIVEIPRWTTAKLEIATKLPLNPIIQDVRNGKMRFVSNTFPYHGYIWNYGALPQTWECSSKCDITSGCKGDDDPIDILEIGDKIHNSGSVVQVKILGIFAVTDEGQSDWKLLAIDTTDPNASRLNDISDIEKLKPGLLGATVDWLKNYKVPEGREQNEFGFDGVPKDAKFAYKIIEETHKFWKELSNGKIENATGIACQRTTDSKSPHYINSDAADVIVNANPPYFRPKDIDPYGKQILIRGSQLANYHTDTTSIELLSSSQMALSENTIYHDVK